MGKQMTQKASFDFPSKRLFADRLKKSGSCRRAAVDQCCVALSSGLNESFATVAFEGCLTRNEMFVLSFSDDEIRGWIRPLPTKKTEHKPAKPADETLPLTALVCRLYHRNKYV